MKIVMSYDDMTDSFWGYFENYQEIAAVGNTRQELKLNLYELFIEVLYQEKEIQKRFFDGIR